MNISWLPNSHIIYIYLYLYSVFNSLNFLFFRGNLEANQCQMESLKTQLSIQKRRLKTEEEFRKQVETDYRSLQEEKRNIDFRY